MSIISIFLSYFQWHYSQSLIDAVLIWRNFLLFFYHYFSLDILLRTFFKPWRRLGEQYPSGLDIVKTFKVFVVALAVNLMMRVAGVIIRSFIISVGVLVEIFAIVLGAVLIVVWFFAPFIVVILFIIGLEMII